MRTDGGTQRIGVDGFTFLNSFLNRIQRTQLEGRSFLCKCCSRTRHVCVSCIKTDGSHINKTHLAESIQKDLCCKIKS